MRLLAVLAIVFGIALAGGALFFANQHLKNQAALANRPTGPVLVDVLAAKEPLSYGETVNLEVAKEKLRWVKWPESAVPDGAVLSIPELLGEDRKGSRTVLRAIEPGELVLHSKLSGFGANARIAALVGDGKRAVSIPIDAVSGVSGFVTPGDRVDIILLRNIQNKLTSSVILQNVPVIATDQSADEAQQTARVARTATVEVSPEEAQTLMVARQTGQLALSLRSAGETAEIAPRPIDVDDLPDQPAPVAAPKPAPKAAAKPTVRVRKGGELQVVPVEPSKTSP